MSRRLYIGRLPTRATTKDLERLFKGFGRIRDIDLKGDFGFVEFDDSRDAEDAAYELNGSSLLGEKLRIEVARNPIHNSQSGRSNFRDGGRSRYGPPERTENRLVVENLSSRCSWQDLKDLMRKAGEVTYADAHKLRRNEAIVEFATRSDMKRALERYNGYELYGRRLRVIEDPHDSRSPSRGKKRSRSISGGYNRRNRTRSGSISRSHSSRSRSPSPPKRARRSPLSSSGSSVQSDKRGPPKGHNLRKERTSESQRSRSKSRSPVDEYHSRSRSLSAPKKSRDRSVSSASHGNESVNGEKYDGKSDTSNHDENQKRRLDFRHSDSEGSRSQSGSDN